jgi:hypothetical protein
LPRRERTGALREAREEKGEGVKPSRFGPRVVKRRTPLQQQHAADYKTRPESVLTIHPADRGLPTDSWWAVPCSTRRNSTPSSRTSSGEFPSRSSRGKCRRRWRRKGETHGHLERGTMKLDDEVRRRIASDQAPLQPARHPAMVERRAQLVEKVLAARQEIAQLFLDVSRWNNSVRKPGEEPIDPDPDGDLRLLLDFYDRILKNDVQ